MATCTLLKKVQIVKLLRSTNETLPCLMRFTTEYGKEIEGEGEFRGYVIPGMAKRKPKKQKKDKWKLPSDRTRKMSPLQEWINVWPTATSFKASAVPFPVKQGFVDGIKENKGYIPDKRLNFELMKIPNFLHLTPEHIRRHCEVIKKFCTDFPENLTLSSESHIRTLFPIEVIESDYCFAAPSIRDPRGRKITLKVNMSSLNLDDHAKDKMIRLLAHRYNRELNEFTIVADSCPTKKQNYDHAMYLLTVLYHESKITEPWEEEKTVEDMEQYFWNINKSKQTIIRFLQNIKEYESSKSIEYLPEDVSEENLLKVKQVEKYKDSMENLMNNGENSESLEQYKQSVLELLNIKPPSHQMDSVDVKT